MKRALLARALALSTLAACNPANKATGIASDRSAAPLSVTVGGAPSSPSSANARTTTAVAVRVVDPPTDGDALSVIRTQRLSSRAEGRVLVVYVSATWCEPCKRSKSELESGALDARLGKTTLLRFDADRDVDRLAAAGYSFRFVPYIALPGPDGAPSDTAQATGKGSEAWRELLAKLDAWQR